MVLTVRLVATIAGTVESFNATAYTIALASTLDGVSPEDIETDVWPASIMVEALITSDNIAIAESARSRLANFSPQQLSEALGVTIEAVQPVVLEKVEIISPRLPPMPPSPEGCLLTCELESAIASAAAALLVLLPLALCLYCGFVYIARRRRERRQRKRKEQGLPPEELDETPRASTAWPPTRPDAKRKRRWFWRVPLRAKTSDASKGQLPSSSSAVAIPPIDWQKVDLIADLRRKHEQAKNEYEMALAQAGAPPPPQPPPPPPPQPIPPPATAEQQPPSRPCRGTGAGGGSAAACIASLPTITPPVITPRSAKAEGPERELVIADSGRNRRESMEEDGGEGVATGPSSIFLDSLAAQPSTADEIKLAEAPRAKVRVKRRKHHTDGDDGAGGRAVHATPPVPQGGLWPPTPQQGGGMQSGELESVLQGIYGEVEQPLQGATPPTRFTAAPTPPPQRPSVVQSRLPRPAVAMPKVKPECTTERGERRAYDACGKSRPPRLYRQPPPRPGSTDADDQIAAAMAAADTFSHRAAQASWRAELANRCNDLEDMVREQRDEYTEAVGTRPPQEQQLQQLHRRRPRRRRPDDPLAVGRSRGGSPQLPARMAQPMEAGAPGADTAAAAVHPHFRAALCDDYAAMLGVPSARRQRGAAGTAATGGGSSARSGLPAVRDAFVRQIV